MAEFRPTLKQPINKMVNKNFKTAMSRYAPTVTLDEIDSSLEKNDYGLKKKIFSLDKMEALVFSDPYLSTIYDDMSEEGKSKFGYHYNETIMNVLFNQYVLNDPTYLQKYKMAIPKVKKRRDKSGINQLKKTGEETMKKRNLTKKVMPKPQPVVDEMTGSGGGGAMGGGSGQFTQALDYKKPINKPLEETTGSASSVAYVGPAVWGGGDLMKTKGKANVKTTPMVKGGTIISINEGKNYLIDPSGFEKYVQELNEKHTYMDAPIIDKTSAFTSNTVKGWDVPDTELEYNTMKTGQPDKPNFKTMEEAKNMNEKAKSKEQQRLFGMAHAVQKGELPASKVGGAVKKIAKAVSPKDVEDFASTKHKNLPEKLNEYLSLHDSVEYLSDRQGEDPFMLHGEKWQFVNAKYPDGKTDIGVYRYGQDIVYDYARWREEMGINENNIKEDATTMANASKLQSREDSMSNNMETSIPIGTQSTGGGGMSESYTALLEEINNELDAFSIHHDKLKRMSEDRKPSAIVLKDRLGKENVKNFKSNLKDSSISKIVDIENSLEYGDQQTEIKDPYKLGQDIEKTAIKAGDMKSGEALKNVGNSANDKGDEIPKRNLTTEEQDEVNLYRNGLHSTVFDNEPGKRFEDRMKKDMGDRVYDIREKQLKFKGIAPMYNKDTQPMETGDKNSAQFNKDLSGWNEREGLKESHISGKYFDVLGKKKIIDFNLNEVKELYVHKGIKRLGLFEVNISGMGNTYTQKVNVNESVVKAIDKFKFYTNGKDIFAVKNLVQSLNENDQRTKKPVLNEQMEKMKHLTGYKAETFLNTNNVKKNRGF
jgi:hypothetical protein